MRVGNGDRVQATRTPGPTDRQEMVGALPNADRAKGVQPNGDQPNGDQPKGDQPKEIGTVGGS